MPVVDGLDAPHATRGFQIEVTPAEFTLAPGGTRQLGAVGRDGSGAQYSVRVDWKVTGGTITPAGLYTAPSTAGSYRVIATRTGDVQADTSVVTVTGPSAPPPPVAAFWIEITPGTASLAAGSSQAFIAKGKDRSGATYAVNVTWSATGGSITAGGVYTAPASAGTWQVIAKRTGDVQADTATITVSGGQAPSLANECARARPEWIWCDDFDSDRLARYFEYDDAKGRFTRQAGVGNNGSTGMKAVYNTTPQTSAGALHLAFGRTPQPYFKPVDAGTANYREVFWRIYVRYPTTWQGAAARSSPAPPASSPAPPGPNR